MFGKLIFPIELEIRQDLRSCETKKRSNELQIEPKSYRPISLLSCTGKIFERLILNLLLEHEREHEIIIPEQFGFRTEHSTVQQILRITEKASLGFNRNRSLGLVLLDLEMAFDCVWHEGLLHKLVINRTPTPLLGIIDSFLHGRKSFVCVNGKFSETYDVPAGVPQGSILSPHLFSIFVNDIPLPKNCNLAMFADGTAIFCDKPWKNIKSLRTTLVDALESTANFFNDWKIKLNANKTEFTVLTRSTTMIKKLENFPPTFNGNQFVWKDCVTYLGVDLDRKLTFKNHIDKVVKRARALVSTLYCLLKKNNSLSLHSKISTYRSIIRPTMTYACQIFNNCAKCHFNKLQVQQNKCLRMILSAPYYTRTTKLHLDSGIPTIRDFVNKLTESFYERCNTHSNELISILGTYKLDEIGRVKHRLPLKL